MAEADTPDRDWTDRVGTQAGEQRQASRGKENYLILLTDELKCGLEGRGAVYDAGVARSAAFVAALTQRLKDKGLEKDWKLISAGTLPVVAVACTDAVASLIRSMPEVDSVAKDFDIEVDRGAGPSR